MYDSWRDWTTHERWTHNRIWQCAEHPSVSFTTAASYSQHLREAHDLDSFEVGLDQLVSMGETALDDVTRSCPFCLNTPGDTSQLRNHIATHLQRIALFTLPRSLDYDDDDDDDDDLEDVSIKANALQNQSQELGSVGGQLASDQSYDADDRVVQASPRTLTQIGALGSHLESSALNSLAQDSSVERWVDHLDSITPHTRQQQSPPKRDHKSSDDKVDEVYEKDFLGDDEEGSLSVKKGERLAKATIPQSSYLLGVHRSLDSKKVRFSWQPFIIPSHIVQGKDEVLQSGASRYRDQNIPQVGATKSTQSVAWANHDQISRQVGATKSTQCAKLLT